MIILKLIIMTVCSALFFWGGFNFNKARRYIMPLILTASLFIFTNFNFYTFFSLVSIGFLTLGYGEKSPLRHVFGDGWGRGIWGLLVAVALSVGVFLSGHIYLYFFLPYLALNFILENALKKLPQIVGDPIIGLGFSSILLILH